MVENKDDRELIDKIQLIIEKLDYEESQQLLERFAEKEMEELKNLVEEAENSKENDETDNKQLRNLFEKPFTLTTIDVLGKKVTFSIVTSFQSGSASFSLQAKCDGSTFKLSSQGFTGTYTKKDKASFTLITVPFSVGPVPLKFTLKAITGYEVKATFTINSSQSTIKLSGSVYGSLDGSVTFDALVISASLGIDARLLTLTLTKIGNLKTGSVTGSTSATIGPVTIYASGHVAGVPWRVDICSTPYKTFNL